MCGKVSKIQTEEEPSSLLLRNKDTTPGPGARTHSAWVSAGTCGAVVPVSQLGLWCLSGRYMPGCGEHLGRRKPRQGAGKQKFSKDTDCKGVRQPRAQGDPELLLPRAGEHSRGWVTCHVRGQVQASRASPRKLPRTLLTPASYCNCCGCQPAGKPIGAQCLYGGDSGRLALLRGEQGLTSALFVRAV